MIDLLRAYFITPHDFIDNLTNQVCEHVPQPTYIQFEERIHNMEDTLKRDEFLQSVIKFTAIELSVQPYIRRHVKQYLLQHGIISTQPTDEGAKVIDVYSPSYRVKHIKQRSLKQFTAAFIQEHYSFDETNGFKDHGDIFLDILMNEKRGLIKVSMGLPEEPMSRIIMDFINMFTSPNCTPFHHQNSRAAIGQLFQDILLPELFKEIRGEFQEAAENHVIEKCKQAFNSLLMTGPFIHRTQ